MGLPVTRRSTTTTDQNLHERIKNRQRGMNEQSRQPLFNGAYTRVSVFHTGSENPSCAEFERAYVKCMDQYGLKMGRKECWKEVEDTAECLYGYKQKARVNAMRLERLKQGRDHIEAPPAIVTTLPMR